MAKFEVNRSFDHRTFGRVGIVELVAEVGEVTIGGKTLPASSVEYLLTFALQNLQDAYAGAESADEAVARWAKKLDRLVEGSIGTREGGDGISVEVKTIRAVLREQVKKALAKEKWAAFNDLDVKVQAEKLDALYAKQEGEAKAAIDKDVAARIKAASDRKSQAAKLAASLDIEL